MDPLKEMFDKKFYQDLAGKFSHADKNFNAKAFVKDVTENIEQLSLNGRLRNTSVVLKKYLPANYTKAIGILFRAAPASMVVQTGTGHQQSITDQEHP